MKLSSEMQKIDCIFNMTMMFIISALSAIAIYAYSPTAVAVFFIIPLMFGLTGFGINAFNLYCHSTGKEPFEL